LALELPRDTGAAGQHDDGLRIQLVEPMRMGFRRRVPRSTGPFRRPLLNHERTAATTAVGHVALPALRMAELTPERGRASPQSQVVALGKFSRPQEGHFTSKHHSRYSQQLERLPENARFWLCHRRFEPSDGEQVQWRSGPYLSVISSRPRVPPEPPELNTVPLKSMRST
jgi:hypothetical protein